MSSVKSKKKDDPTLMGNEFNKAKKLVKVKANGYIPSDLIDVDNLDLSSNTTIGDISAAIALINARVV